jgi:hypothetical protein
MLFWMAAPVLLCADIASLHPLYTPETTATNPALVGIWGTKGSAEFRIEAEGEQGYRVIIDGEQVFTLRLVRVGSETVGDVAFTAKFFDAALPIHAFARLRLQGDQLRVDGLGSNELETRIRRTRQPPHEQLNTGGEELLVLTAATPELHRFVLDCLEQPDSFGNSMTFERAGPEVTAADLNERSWKVAARRGAARDQYVEAVRQAEEAVALIHDNPGYWNTVAAARLRAGRIDQALAALGIAESLRREIDPGDLAVRVLILCSLGRDAEARQAMDGLRAALANHRHCGISDILTLLWEAEDLMAPGRK